MVGQPAPTDTFEKNTDHLLFSAIIEGPNLDGLQTGLESVAELRIECLVDLVDIAALLGTEPPSIREQDKTRVQS